ncbi:MAG: alpha/beta hydrolase fold domain-containing protein [Sphingomonadales bacterium]|nr:alpha/beta hydrolase fold domain-containing protein [Sphingomonadales bacterium]
MSGAALPAERAGHAAPPDLAERRRQMTAAQAAGTWAVTPPPEEVFLAGRRTLVFRPPTSAAPRCRMLHLHGGAFRLGTPEMEAPLAVALTAACPVEIIAPQYRLAPEHPFPAGLNDALAVLAALPADGLPLVLSGDSAGGGLAAGLAMLAAEAGIRLAALVMHSPWLDLTVTAPSYDANAATDPLFSRASAEAGAALYLQGLDPRHPLASPLHGALAGLPRCLVTVGSGEVLVDDARRFHARLREAGVASELCEIAGMDHVAVVRSLELPGARRVFARIVHLLGDIAAR